MLALGIIRQPTVWGFMTSQYPGIHDIGLASDYDTVKADSAQGHGGGGSVLCIVLR